MSKVYNLFLSHSWAHSNHYNSLLSLLRETPYFSFKDYSVPKDDPIYGARTDAALAQAIANQMQPCHAIVIMAGVYASHSKWMEKEIRIANQQYNKPIIAVRPWGSQSISTVADSAATETVGWNASSVVAAIRRHSL
ncbi:TIR domain-containing protein [Desulfovibrio cuneatus]|uniref:TIR domain-containing protein n=1 Tax=Desulfovibrio cuneatus TaxID=159728 RepID=UPI0004870889|nr:TIR domain-containing protein [Desulfovibrio cuneatus]